MNYVLEPYCDNFTFTFRNESSDCCLGFVVLREGVWRILNFYCEDIAVIKSIEEAIPTIAAYYAKHPPHWERESARQYTKMTQFGSLRVEQNNQAGGWIAYRWEYYPLLRYGEPAIFATSEKAQRLADAHVCDGYPNSTPKRDGFSWLPGPEIVIPNRAAPVPTPCPVTR
jgi:hypothetical protein